MKKTKKSKSALQNFLPESVNGGAVQDSPFISPVWNQNRRIGDVNQARQLTVQLFNENQLRSQNYAQIRNQIEGGRPFDPGALARLGEGWRTNANFNDARAAFRRVSMPYWKMVHEVPRKISVNIHSKAPDIDTSEVALAECFDMFLDDWGPDYFQQFSGMADDYVMYGTGHTMWADEDSPRFQWMPAVQVMVPKRTKANVDKWELLAARRDMTADELLTHVRDDESKRRSKAAGWNPQAVMQAIELASPGPSTTRYFDPNYWQDMIVANDLVIGGVWPPVTVWDLWAKSKDGKIRHYIFTDKADVNGYLYEAEEPVDKFRKIFGVAFYNVGSNGLYHSVKGFGVMNYYYFTTINRTKCRVVDASIFATGLNFTQDDDTPRESPPVENYSAVNIFPKGLTQIPNYPQISQATELIGMLAANQSENNFTYNEPQKEIADTKTARQAVILADIANEMSTASSSIFLSQMGTNFYLECFRRLIRKGSTDSDAKKFRKRALSMGVSMDLIDLMASEDESKNIEYTVKTGASPTTASPVARSQITEWLMQKIYPLPSANRRAIEEFGVANMTGSEGVSKFLLPIGVASDPRARREAIMENTNFGEGIALGPPPNFGVDPSDAHVEHLDEHLKPMEMIVQAAQQRQPIGPQHMIAVQNTMPHAAMHLQMLSGNEAEKQQYDILKARFTAVASVIQGIIARLNRAQSAAQASGQPMQPGEAATALAQPQQ